LKTPKLEGHPRDIETVLPQEFVDPNWTATGAPRAFVALHALETLWFNTGTLCNIACANCYIESSPRNDRLAYLTLADVTDYLDEIERELLPVRMIGFTGGEPFMNPDFLEILRETLSRGFETLTLTNAMKPMMRRIDRIATLAETYGAKFRLRVSLDDWRAEVHDTERGAGAFNLTMEGLAWLSGAGVTVEVAGRFLSSDGEAALRAGYGRLFSGRGIAIDSSDSQALMLLPEMIPFANPPEISEACWGILRKSPADMMCSNARMVVKRRNSDRPAVLACTLLPYEEGFELGATLAAANRPVPLAHKYCAMFCVLGGGACGAPRAAHPATCS